MSVLKMQTKCSGKNEGDIKTDNKIMGKYVGYVLLENSVEIKLASHFIRTSCHHDKTFGSPLHLN
jgi:hypothetical protein